MENPVSDTINENDAPYILKARLIQLLQSIFGAANAYGTLYDFKERYLHDRWCFQTPYYRPLNYDDYEHIIETRRVN
ncbi:hypothetical protein N7G274_007534 [Stereocaulon virgatum]|uniref:Uncharacterized protein n=1 Tax=Stereocaulon virgatum TaxID=373712 RepID=A0ABR4A3N1_9LECA